MNITIDALRGISALPLDRLEALLGHARIDLADGCYWTATARCVSGTDVEPVDLRLGRLSADWASLGDLLRGETVRVAAGFTRGDAARSPRDLRG